MPTLINYNQATFKNQVKPNKRRLQELQHSAARAHAARVAYWRKKGIPLDGSSSPERRRSSEDDDPSPLSGPVVFVKQENDRGNKTLSRHNSSSSGRTTSAKVTTSGTDSGNVSEQHLSRSCTAPNQRRLGSQSSSSFNGQHVKRLADTRLTWPPTSHLFDPLNSLPIQQDAEVVAAMDHYINNWAPSQRPGLKYQTKDNPLIRDAFPAALQNVELFEATIALCLSFKAAGQNFQSRVCNWSLYHKGQALSAIRKKLNAGWVDEAVILATVFLMIIDNVFLDVHAYETHLYGLRKMARAFKAASSRELFSGSLLSFIAWAESNALLLFGDRIAPQSPKTSGSRLEYPSHPFPSTLTITIGTLTPGFQLVASQGGLSVEVLAILAKTVHWTRCIDPRPGESPSGTDQAFLMNFDPRANSAELMRLCRVSDEGHIIERAICKAVYIYHANLLGWTCRCSGYRQVVEELGHALRLWVFREAWNKNLWKWLALITANAARRGKLEHLQTEAMTSLLAMDESDKEWEQLRTVTKEFLYHSKLEREWKSCWDQAQIATV
ncbi:hypothetical protein H2200_010405 [Cladophialophora chaetospira]|uniref:Uncharacterized protein n=1 Tax=Cladophialophora chaetospira TaxID=386627 RepID=A0AA39CE71_9EURO|nr:hypothetical protein H2200_010405 [Cladophialophora chaetospira]